MDMEAMETRDNALNSNYSQQSVYLRSPVSHAWGGTGSQWPDETLRFLVSEPHPAVLAHCCLDDSITMMGGCVT